jgi:hypothetical protein
MSTHDRSDSGTETRDPFETRWAWKAGAVAGLVATLVMGVAISLTDLATLRGAIAGLYGLRGNLAAGWGAHLFHGTLFGVIFAWVLADPGLQGLSDWAWKTVVAGVVYGLVLAVVGAGIVMPIWLGLVGFPAPPSLPNVTIPMLGWHVVYGAVLGGLFHSVARS